MRAALFIKNGTSTSSKTRTGNTSHLRAFKPKLFPNKSHPERCPLAAFKLFEDKRPKSMREPDSPFYLAINTDRPTENSRWFKASPMGVDTIGKFMPRMAAKASLVGPKLTNHSVRRTMLSQLFHSGKDPVLISQLSGQKNPSSVINYAVARNSSGI